MYVTILQGEFERGKSTSVFSPRICLSIQCFYYLYLCWFYCLNKIRFCHSSSAFEIVPTILLIYCVFSFSVFCLGLEGGGVRESLRQLFFKVFFY